ncbi:endonuclease/exonuclease/phosphatase family protein [Flavobacteriaceae bacterium F08102]|nr:endonuclease/exonuclease/phosphatase family protein [Flavobacteriaceae bacterium F08102]
MFNKIVFVINTVFAIALVVAFFIPNLPPIQYGAISLLSLLVPVLIITNALFVIYWIVIGFKKQFLQSFIVLILCLFFLPKLYQFTQSNRETPTNSLSILTYNVRKFNKYKWIKTDSVPNKIRRFIESTDADVVLLQEYEKNPNFNLQYPYFYNHYSNEPSLKQLVQSGLATYSKYPIIGSGSIGININSRFVIYTDIVKNKDTIRIFNIHLESLGVDPNQDYLGFEKSENLVKRVRNAFQQQQRQIDTLTNTIKGPYKKIIAGDLNNSAFSWAYKHLKGNFKDSFEEAGYGFGKTYSFKNFPLRIDYCFADSTFTFNSHINYDIHLSDHFPVMAVVGIN